MPKRLKTAASIIFFSLLFNIAASAQWERIPPQPKPLNDKTDTVEMTFLGDIMMHAKQMEYDWNTFLSDLEDITEKSDISVANMEFTLAGKPYSGYPSFSAPDGYAKYVASCGVDVFLTANNHIMDKGTKGLLRTLEIYESMRDSCGVQYTGSSLNAGSDGQVNPLIVVGHGIRIALVNFTYGTNHEQKDGWPAVKNMKKGSVLKMIESAKERNADFIIALPHWGMEYRLRHSTEQEEWAGWLVEQGVDLIVGSHPHVIQDTTHIKGIPVIYSIGNAISNMSAENTRLEMAVKVKMTKSPDGVKEMLEPELEFLWCCLPGSLNDSYATIPLDKYAGRREEWKEPSDYDNMMDTYKRVTKETGIYEKEL